MARVCVLQDEDFSGTWLSFTVEGPGADGTIHVSLSDAGLDRLHELLTRARHRRRCAARGAELGFDDPCADLG